jgi:2,3-bisphosphoglycerate-dependent phosphoglycerate mutase
MATRVYLLRHAETADPTVFHGAESDIGLSAKGQRQAEVIADVLSAKRPDVVISSAMLRARTTALPLAERCGLTLQVEADLHERKIAALSGMPFDAQDGVWPKTVRRWMAGDTRFAHPGAESFDELCLRLLPVWNRLIDQHRDRTIVLVAHGIVCKVLLVSVLAGWSVADWQKLGSIPNAAITELREEDGLWRATRIAEWPAEMIAAQLT